MKELTKGLIALVVIIGVTVGIYAYETMEKRILKTGDFAEIYYIGYFENGTVFSSSFQDNVTFDTPFNSKKYNLTPLKIYFGEGFPDKYPEGWEYSDIGSIENMRIYEIEGLYEEMKGMKKGDEKIVELPPDEAFGMKVENGTVFNTSMIFGYNERFEIVNIKGVTVDLKWLCEEGKIITFPQYWYNLPVQQPYWLWENATEVVSFNETDVVLKTTPNQLDNITLFPWWEGASNASYNDTKIYITTTPPLGNFTISYWGGYVTGKVVEVTEDKIKIEYTAGNQTIEDEINRTMVFNRTIEMPIIFKDIQKISIEDELRENGYSFHELAGKNVIFRVKLLKIYRLS